MFSCQIDFFHPLPRKLLSLILYANFYFLDMYLTQPGSMYTF